MDATLAEAIAIILEEVKLMGDQRVAGSGEQEMQGVELWPRLCAGS